MKTAFIASSIALGAIACAPSRCPEVAPVTAPREVASAAPSASAPPAGPRVAITLRPSPAKGTVDVEIRASGEAEALSKLSIAPDGGLASLHLGEIRDERGPIEAKPEAGPDGRVIVALSRAPA